MSNKKEQTTVDAYCPECETYICDERVTFEECCDTCGTHIEYHTKDTEVKMSNKQQTAVEWFHQKTWALKIQLEKGEISIGEYASTYSALFEQAKEMEKAEKIKFATDFFFWWYNQTSGTNTYEAVEKFYNETYGGNK